MSAAELRPFVATVLTLTIVLAADVVARADERGRVVQVDDDAQYDEFGRRPPQPRNELALPDPVLDPDWPMPEPGAPASKPELLDRDEERLDPLHEDKPQDEMDLPPSAAGQPDELPPSADELLRRGPAGEGQAAPLLQQEQQDEEDRDDRSPGDSGEPTRE